MPVTGIYKIKNTKNGRVYIGQSKDVQCRFNSHKSELRNNKHYNQHLQYAWKKYGEQAFEFSLIEECEERELDEREMFWISELDAISSGYNITPGGAGVKECMKGIPKSEEHKTKDSIGVKKWCAVHGGSKSTKIVCLNTGEVFRDAVVASKSVGVDASSIRKCCNGKRKSAGSINGERLAWMNFDDYEQSSCEYITDKITYANTTREYAAKPVLCITTNKTFDSIISAAKEYGLATGGIIGCCKGYRKSTGGLQWAYANEGGG